MAHKWILIIRFQNDILHQSEANTPGSFDAPRNKGLAYLSHHKGGCWHDSNLHTFICRDLNSWREEKPITELLSAVFARESKPGSVFQTDLQRRCILRKSGLQSSHTQLPNDTFSQGLLPLLHFPRPSAALQMPRKAFLGSVFLESGFLSRSIICLLSFFFFIS